MDSLAISTARPRIEALIAASLEGYEGSVVALAPGRWQLGLPGQGKARAALVIDKDWLVLERALGGGRRIRVAHTRCWTRHLLDARVALPAGARPVLPPGEAQVRLRAEIPIELRHLGNPECLRRWIASLCAKPPFGRSAGRAAAQGDGTAFADSACDAEQVDLLALCEQAGWPATPRGTSGDLVVELPGRDGAVCHAIVSGSRDGARLRVALALASDACPTVSSLAALDIALLRTAGTVRMVRAMATHTAEGVDAAVEVRLDGLPEATALGHGLSALAVAHQQIAEEIDALASDGALASAYLTVQGVR